MATQGDDCTLGIPVTLFLHADGRLAKGSHGRNRARTDQRRDRTAWSSLTAPEKGPTHFAPGLKVVRSVMVGVLEKKKTVPLINLFG